MISPRTENSTLLFEVQNAFTAEISYFNFWVLNSAAKTANSYLTIPTSRVNIFTAPISKLAVPFCRLSNFSHDTQFVFPLQPPLFSPDFTNIITYSTTVHSITLCTYNIMYLIFYTSSIYSYVRRSVRPTLGSIRPSPLIFCFFFQGDTIYTCCSYMHYLTPFLLFFLTGLYQLNS